MATATKSRTKPQDRTALRAELEREHERLEQEADEASDQVRERHARRLRELGGYPKREKNEPDNELRARCTVFERDHDKITAEAREEMEAARRARNDAHRALLDKVRTLAFGDDVDQDAVEFAEQISDKQRLNTQLQTAHRAGDKRRALAFARVAWDRRWDTLAASVIDARLLTLLDILEGDRQPIGTSRWVIR